MGVVDVIDQDEVEQLQNELEQLKTKLADAHRLLELELQGHAEARRELEAEREEHGKTEQRYCSTLERSSELHQQFAELKERVAILGAQNSEMRGYIGRVQEDDVVREDLVPVGDVQGGEMYLSPKRKHRNFDERLYEAKSEIGGMSYASASTRRRRHWVNY